MVIRVLTAAVASALLAGCVSVGPNYQAPPAQPVVLQGAAAPVFSTRLQLVRSRRAPLTFSIERLDSIA